MSIQSDEAEKPEADKKTNGASAHTPDSKGTSWGDVADASAGKQSPTLADGVDKRIRAALSTERAMTPAEVQAEVNTSGEHVPEGIIRAGLDALVDAGAIEREKGDPPRYRQKAAPDRKSVINRRSALIEVLVAAGGDGEDVEQIVRDIQANVPGASSVDVRQDLASLSEKGLVDWVRGGESEEAELEGDDVPESDRWWLLSEVGVERMGEAGARVLAEMSVPPEPVATPTPASEQLDKLRVDNVRQASENVSLRGQIALLLKWFVDNNIPAPVQRATPPGRTITVWSKSVPVDAAEKGRIFDEQRKVRQQITRLQEQAKADKQGADARIKTLENKAHELDAEADCLTRDLEIPSYREVDTANRCYVIRAAQDACGRREGEVLELIAFDDAPAIQATSPTAPTVSGAGSSQPNGQDLASAPAALPPAPPADPKEDVPTILAHLSDDGVGAGLTQAELTARTGITGERLVEACKDARIVTDLSTTTPRYSRRVHRDIKPAAGSNGAGITGPLTPERVRQVTLEVFARANHGILVGEIHARIGHALGQDTPGPGVKTLINSAVDGLADRHELDQGGTPDGEMYWLSSFPDPRPLRAAAPEAPTTPAQKVRAALKGAKDPLTRGQIEKEAGLGEGEFDVALKELKDALDTTGQKRGTRYALKGNRSAQVQPQATA